MLDKVAALQSTSTWDLVSFPLGKITVGCKWLCIVKIGSDGKIDHLKARLVAKGYTQMFGLDEIIFSCYFHLPFSYDDCYSPMTTSSTIQ